MNFESLLHKKVKILENQKMGIIVSISDGIPPLFLIEIDDKYKDGTNDIQ